MKVFIDVNDHNQILYAVIESSDGSCRPIDLSDVDNLYHLLRNYAYQALLDSRSAKLEELLVGGRWLFPVTPKDYRGSGPCVYFASHPFKLGLIKIGSTINVSTRRNSLRTDLGGHLPTILAIVISERMRELERSFQAKFSAYQVGPRKSEWFQDRPVMDYLATIKNGGFSV